MMRVAETRELSRSDAIKFMWALFWRLLCTTAAVMLVAFSLYLLLARFVVSVGLMSVAASPVEAPLFWLLVAASAFFAMDMYLHWIINIRTGSYSLQLVAEDEAE